MDYWDKKLIREQLDRKLSPFRDLLPIPRKNWIRTIREALGMTTTELGKRIGVDQSRIVHMEKSETTGSLKLSTMEKIADGLDATFIYGFVPNDGLEAFVRKQAEKLARKRMKHLDQTMKLELQGLSKAQRQKALEDMIEKILIEGDKELWTIP